MTTKVKYNPSNKDHVNKLREHKELQELQYKEDIQTLANTPAGVRFLTYLLREGKAFGEPFTGNSQTYFNNGFEAFAREKIYKPVCMACPHLIRELQDFLPTKEDEELQLSLNE